ncbi:NADH-quinone oxidoreductase subunit M [Luteitalea sp.]|uniref:NADH-quinone oxidoreductase subunit M n=1 Tax=Luteitalea sp. TaxID=2004800 RepID=UPI0025BEEBDA|nr:NADH-quinone oxidoreductase subunit M [Luteitalea sp.]
MTFPLLSLTVFAPLLGALLLLAIPNKDGERNGLVRVIALGISLVVFALTVAVWAAFDGTSADFQMVERVPWIPAFGIDYHLGIDGISLWLVVLAGFLTPLALLSSWHGVEKKVKEFSFFLLALEAGMIGVFLSLDLFLFYIFWDAMLIPMYFLIGIWGYDQRVYAAVKFILYTMAGSVLMLIAIIGLAVIHAQATGQYSFNLLQLYQLTLDPRTQLWFFLAFALAFAIKVPLFPFHTWLPDAHVQAPTAGSVILAGVLLKMGTYGLIRFAFPLFPDAALQAAPYIGTLAVIGIVYAALVAMVQPDMKKLVAYSSVSHMGVIVLGICAANVQGMQGAIYQMLNHGISTGGLFLIVGMLSDRRHTRQIAEFGGLKHVMPKMVAAFLLITLSSIGMPGLNGFIGEFLSLMGGYRWRPDLAAVAATGVILSAVYMLWMFQRVNYGPLTNPKNKGLHDLEPREWAALGPTLVLAIVMGVVPNFFLAPMAPSVDRLVQRLHAQRPALAEAVPVTTPKPVPASVSLTPEQAAR